MMKSVKVLLGVLALCIVCIVLALGYLTIDLKETVNMQISKTEVPPLKDGIHTGSLKGNRWQNEVAMTIENGKIVNIELLQDVMVQEEGVFDELKKSVIENQSLDVDTISGATATSKAYLKAMEDAMYP